MAWKSGWLRYSRVCDNLHAKMRSDRLSHRRFSLPAGARRFECRNSFRGRGSAEKGLHRCPRKVGTESAERFGVRLRGCDGQYARHAGGLHTCGFMASRAMNSGPNRPPRPPPPPPFDWARVTEASPSLSCALLGSSSRPAGSRGASVRTEQSLAGATCNVQTQRHGQDGGDDNRDASRTQHMLASV